MASSREERVADALFQEEPVYIHPEDVEVAPHQQVVERVQVVLPDGDMGHVTVAGEVGEAWADEAFARRREEALAAVQAEYREAGHPDHPPAIVGREILLRSYQQPQDACGAAGGFWERIKDLLKRRAP